MVCATRDKAGTKDFITSLTKVAPSLGMTMNKPKMFPLLDNRPAFYIQVLDMVIECNPSNVMFVVPNNKGDH